MNRSSKTLPPHRRLYKRLMAALLSQGSRAFASAIAPRKEALLRDLGGDVLEIGPGGGANFAYYSPQMRWVGVEPNPYMHDYLRAAAAQYPFAIDIRLGSAEELPAADNSIDAVVSTHVLCSVPNQARALAEIQRVLKPGGRFIFIEHVAAPRGTRQRQLQDWVRPVWQALADGCHPNLETWQAINAAGFATLDYEHFAMGLPVIKPHIAGYVIK